MVLTLVLLAKGGSVVVVCGGGYGIGDAREEVGLQRVDGLDDGGGVGGLVGVWGVDDGGRNFGFGGRDGWMCWVYAIEVFRRGICNLLSLSERYWRFKVVVSCEICALCTIFASFDGRLDQSHFLFLCRHLGFFSTPCISHVLFCRRKISDLGLLLNCISYLARTKLQGGTYASHPK